MPPTSATHPRPNSEVLPRVGAPPRAQRYSSTCTRKRAIIRCTDARRRARHGLQDTHHHLSLIHISEPTRLALI
eukprot:12515191-Alexandrium_andersonii.AAC.1